MKRKLTLLTLSALLLASCHPAPDAVAVNPLTYSDIPDNDVVRDGDDFYMVSTTMYFCPGAPIMHSRDLVHWRITGYVYDCLEDDDVYNLQGGRNAYGHGQWATTLRQNDGTWYALFIAGEQGKTYVYACDDLKECRWRRHAVYDRVFHDAGLLFDGGRAYVVWGNGDLRITELEPDLSAVKADGVDQLLLATPRHPGLRAEGTHVYHIGDYYYLLTIGWPWGDVRTETCWRSTELLGDYESKVVLHGTIGGRGDGVAQGAIVDTPRGDWYAIMFQDHGAVGRIPTLQPVTWTDGWPMMGENGVPMEEVTVNLPEDRKGDYVWSSDEFDDSRLQLVWQWNHRPMDDAWSLAERKGWLRLHTATVTDDLFAVRGTLTQRTAGPHCISQVKMDASGMAPGDRAGICAFQSHYATIGVEVDSVGGKWLVATVMNQQPEEVLRRPLESDDVYLRIDYTFTDERTGTHDVATIAYSYDGQNWSQPGAELHMRYTLDLFTGYRTALYSYATRALGGHADFDYFRQTTY